MVFRLLVIATILLNSSLIFASEWGFEDINLSKTLNIKPRAQVLIAIIDTGFDTQHPALKNTLWRNPGEIPNNNIDDDKNGFVDDVYGWDFARGTPLPEDNHGHGTHVAGLIHKIAPEAKFMILKYYEPKLNPQDTVRFTIAAFEYAVKMGAQIINYSGGGASRSRDEFRALDEARKKGILVVAAAGNEGQNSDLKPYYPADYDLSNILSITAHNPRREILVTSNYGIKSVDLSAPGEEIRSTVPGGGYMNMTGTSQATALAAGVAALTWSQHREIKTPEELISHLVNTGAIEQKQTGKTLVGRRLDAFRALALYDSLVEPRPEAKSINRQPSSPPSSKTLAEQLSLRLSRPRVIQNNTLP